MFFLIITIIKITVKTPLETKAIRNQLLFPLLEFCEAKPLMLPDELGEVKEEDVDCDNWEDWTSIVFVKVCLFPSVSVYWISTFRLEVLNWEIT